MAFRAMIMGLGLLFCILLGFRYRIWYFPKLRGPQCRPQNIRVLITAVIMGVKGDPNVGKPPFGACRFTSAGLGLRV